MSARLGDSDGRFIEIEVLGYEFPSITDSYWDSNWLFVRLSANDGKSSWRASEAAFGSPDLERLVADLGSLAREHRAFDWDPLEPYIRIIGEDHDSQFRITIELFRPGDDLEQEMAVVMGVTTEEVVAFTAVLAGVLARFPVRVRDLEPEPTSFDRLREMN
jgi:hypothetical protein